METGHIKLKKLLQELEEKKGRHTELVSVYVPAGFSLNEINTLLANEIALTQNVKSKAVRKNVTDALTKIVQHLKLYKRTPEHGLAIFCGNVAEQEGQTDIKIWAVEPPEPLTVKMYWCDQRFELEPLSQQLKEKEVYGLVVFDTKEATIGLLKGKTIQVLRHLDSIVPGKFIKGGQCLVPETLVVASDGNILRIGELSTKISVHSVDFNDSLSIKHSNVFDFWETDKEEIYKIITKYPRFEIVSSRDHIFFVWNNEKILEKPAENLTKGEYLLIPEKIDVKGEKQYVDIDISIESHEWKDNRDIELPRILNDDLAQLIGYFIGDGNYDKNRICFSESDKAVAFFYKKMIKKLFNADIGFRYRKDKKYYELKLYSVVVLEFFKKNFIENKYSANCVIPKKVLKSENKTIASFLKGIFDAEGYVSSKLAIGINNNILIKQIQLCLLRLGILSSFLEYDNRRNTYTKNHRFTIEISEKKSLEIFRKLIGFTSKNKMKKLTELIRKKTDRSNVRKILISGKEIANIIKRYGLHQRHFEKVSSFFRNERQMSKNTFLNSILAYVKSNKGLYKELKKFLEYRVLPVKINNIEIYRKPVKMIDISVEKQNFIANGLIVHNSAQRFQRVREGLINDWYKEIAESVKGRFAGQELKGILLGGPGMSKEDFYKGGYLETDMKNKILGLQDVGYTNEQGLHELVDRSSELLKEAAVTKEKDLCNKFLNELQKDSGKVAYGLNSVLKALEAGSVELILISECFEFEEVELLCSCGFSEKKFAKSSEKEKVTCSKCGRKPKIVGEQDGLDAIEEKAKRYGSRVEIVSRETREGEQLFALGGIGAFLRWKL